MSARKSARKSARSRKSSSPAPRTPVANDFVRITWKGDGGHDCILLMDEEGDLIPHPVDESWLDESLVFHPNEDTWKFLTGDKLEAAKETWEGGSHGGDRQVARWLKLFAVAACLFGFQMLRTTLETPTGTQGGGEAQPVAGS